MRRGEHHAGRVKEPRGEVEHVGRGEPDVHDLDAAGARDIADYYDQDEPFREMVNRYIHDFESMLRSILAQRDGSPLGVTLLSSDMGKLYVAMAQAIERLR